MDYKRKEVFLRIKKSMIAFLVLLSCMLCGCNEGQTSEPRAWIPTSDTGIEKQVPSKETESNSAQVVSVHSTKELTTALLRDSGRRVADMLWENQKASGVYRYDTEQLEKGKLLVYYISSSEGDDTNSGLSPETPKKSLAAFSEISNVNILLKCGDIFDMSESFIVGNNVTVATYGEGSRPVLNFYQPLKVQWKQSASYENVWYTDLTGNSVLYDGTKEKSNCNIGQLMIDGECNWKRKIKDDGEDFNYAEYLINAADGSWAVDWENSVLYLYSDSDPSKKEISYALPAHGLQMNNIQDSQVLGLEITGVGFHGVSLTDVNNVKIQSCYIHHIGGALLKNTGPRYGNAVELWENGQEVMISHNMADWIFDACYTNQGSSASEVEKNILFYNNIGRYCFWGIETWGDGFAEQEFENIEYKDNILMNACDVTAPKSVVYCNEKEQLIDGTGNLIEAQVPYVSYRGGIYTYHQMSLLNVADNRKAGEVEIKNNVFWATNRFLCMFGKHDEGRKFPLPEGNLFYAEIPTEGICLFRYSDSDGTKHYLQQLPLGEERNTLIVGVGLEKENAETVLQETLETIANGIGQE